jgi:hypothetical protein
MSAAPSNNYALSHGHNRRGKRTKAYRTWAHILGRCNNPTDRDYKNYGGRGISVCQRWHSFENFLADMGEPSPHLTIERIDNNKGYYKSNCLWATHAEQHRNTRRTIIIDGLCLKDYCAKHHLPYEGMQARIRRGMSPQEAVTSRAIRTGSGRVIWTRF